MFNKAFLIGRLTRDPEKRFTTAGVPVTRFTIAVNRNVSRNLEREADFIQVVAWRKLAEICGEYLKKGRLVAIEGALRINNFTGRDGVKRSFAEIVAENMQMLEKKPTAERTPEAAGKSQDEDVNFNPGEFET
jgi:single-strand DNA-binding protein